MLKPGGAAFSLDFSRPASPIVRGAYLCYLSVVGAVVGWALHGDPDAYRYIAASLRNYPVPGAVSALMTQRGFSEVRCYPVLGGLLAIHSGVRKLKIED